MAFSDYLSSYVNEFRSLSLEKKGFISNKPLMMRPQANKKYILTNLNSCNQEASTPSPLQRKLTHNMAEA